MSSGLFRKQAVEARSQHGVSSATLVVPLSVTASTIFISALAASILALLVFGQYAPKDSVRGYITTTESNVRVFAQSDGTIEEMLVQDGDWVESGQSLLRLGTSRGVAQSSKTRESIMAALRAEQDSLVAEIESIQESFAVKKTAYEEELQSLEGRLKLLSDQKATLLQAAEIAGREVERLVEMDSPGFISVKDIDDARAALLEVNLRLKAVEIDSDDVRTVIRTNEAALSELPHIESSRVAEKESEYQRLTARIAEGLAVSEQTVVAPSPGIVTGLLVRTGQTISANSPLLSLVPRDGTFYAELLIPTRSIGFIRSGAPVKIRYDAYPYQKYGTYDGVVDYVSRTTTLPGDKSFPMLVPEAVYIARITVLQQTINAHAEEQSLQSGMTLTADIHRDKRRIIEWVFDPLISAKQRL